MKLSLVSSNRESSKQYEEAVKVGFLVVLEVHEDSKQERESFRG